MGTANRLRASERDMMLLLLGVSGMLFNHPRSTISTPTLVPSAITSVTIVVDRSSAVPESLVLAMVEETATIWRPIRVDVRGRASAVSPANTIVHVVVTDDPVDDSSAEERLGWIRFVAPSQPEPVIYLSRFAARQLLDATPAVRTRPATYRDVLLARIMGRALAHELGHYLLASTAHSSFGLMRGSWPLDLLIAPDRAAFGLTEEWKIGLQLRRGD